MDPILIVDDEKDNLEALQRLLRGLYAITITTSPFEGLKLVQRQGFNVVVSDQRMAEMTGVEFLEKVKSVAPSATRILLTGYTDIESVVGAINRGNIYRYIAKPWDPEDLKLTLRQANDAYHLRKEIEEKNRSLLKTNEELQQALEELKLLDQAKARFLSLISHELNTPLTVLNSFVELLEERKHQLPEEIQKAVTSISNASERFSDIIAEVLTYVKLEMGKELKLSALDLERETIALKEATSAELGRRQIRLSVERRGDPVIRCDLEKMRLALRKVLEDVLKRTPSQTEIKIKIGAKEGSVHYSIWRLGEVLSPHALNPLDVQGNILHHQRGLGLSLAIAKLIVESHGGAISYTSEPKAGTRIVMQFPSGAEESEDEA